MCSSIISQIIDDLESGGMPKIYFFSSFDCAGGQWPIDSSFFSESMYNTPILALTICPQGLEKLACPVPAVVSMAFAPNLRVTFYGNDSASGVNARVKEIGRTNFYSADPVYAQTAHIADLTINQGVLQWYSSDPTCQQGEKNGCHKDQPEPDNCVNPVSTPFDTDGKLLHSMISCNSQLWPSFGGINVGKYIDGTGDTTWDSCKTLSSNPDQATFAFDRQDFCVQKGFATIENLQYQTTWSDQSTLNNCGSGNAGFFQACSCVANLAEAQDSSLPKTYTNNFGSESGSCSPNFCGACNAEVNFIDHHFSCACAEGATLVLGSTKQIEIGFVTNDNKSATWEEVQVEWCVSGLSVGGINIARYTSGTPTCDAVMRRACSSTSHLTVNPTLDKQCQCVIEEKVLQEQFSNIQLPSACFSSLCNINGADVYKTKQQLTGCDGRLCSQILSIHGVALLAQGVQEVLCNGVVYDVSRVATDGDVPLVSQVVPSYGGFVVGPAIYVSAALLAILFVLCVIWIVRRIRNKRRENAITQQEFETSLLGQRK
jgi:hypothetical protein